MAEAQHQHVGHTAARPQISLFASCLIAMVRLYQITLGKLMGGHCRFAPTCSHYAIEAIESHGAVRGSLLTIRRLTRCHPFGGSGEDPVPRAAITGKSR